MRSFKHAVHLGRSSPCVFLPTCIQSLLSWQLGRAAPFWLVSGDPVPKSSPGSHAELSSPLWDFFSSLCAGTSLSHAAQLLPAHTEPHSLRGLSHGGENPPLCCTWQRAERGRGTDCVCCWRRSCQRRQKPLHTARETRCEEFQRGRGVPQMGFGVILVWGSRWCFDEVN